MKNRRRFLWLAWIMTLQPLLAGERVPGEYLVAFSLTFAEVKTRLPSHFQLAVTPIPGLPHWVHLVAKPPHRSITETEVRQRLQQNKLIASQQILTIEPVFKIHLFSDLQPGLIPNDPLIDEQWAIYSPTSLVDTRITHVWDHHTGSRQVIVAVLDTGIDYLHPDLAENMWVNPRPDPHQPDRFGYDFFNQDPDPMDDHSHGTHCAGIIGAQGNNQMGIAGVNWKIRLMALKIFGKDGKEAGTTAIAAKAIGYALKHGAHIINSSWGSWRYSRALRSAIAHAQKKGVLFVAAAGNRTRYRNNDFFPTFPASYWLNNILSVANVTPSGTISPGSKYGKRSIDIAAPGTNILSTTLNGTYGYKSGTSMATPFVSGVAALLLAINPQFSYKELKQAILRSAHRTTFLKGRVKTGGYIDAQQAITQAELIRKNPPKIPAVESR